MLSINEKSVFSGRDFGDVTLDNLLDEPEIDMNEFLLHIAEDIKWVGDLGGSNVKETETREIKDIEFINNEVFLYESSSDEGGSNMRRNSIKAIRRAIKNSKARVSDPFFVYQKFTLFEELKDAIRKHVVEKRRELDFIKNDKNRVRAICKGTIPDLGLLDSCGPSQSNKKSEENKCTWVLYACKWEQDDLRKRAQMSTNKICESMHLQVLGKEIVQQIESNLTVPIRALQEQLQREYQVDISKMKVFGAKTNALNQVRGNYEELRTRNPGTTVKIYVESEPNLASESRTFKRIYIYLGPLKKGFLAGKGDYLGLYGTFMKGPYRGMILTTVARCKYISCVLDGNNCTYPLAYAVVEAESINSWTWFLRCLGDDIDFQSSSNFTFISD
uniref:MULE transposase domain-containing protein n=1 Tax=Lactuca sativa TaxID=4236 RepID=A0A9R1XBF1_LACSA|nr:hypothetical protein LSAT_V11C500264130 [Lactuca sativa]